MVAQGVRLFRLFPEYQAWSVDSPAAQRVVGMVEEAGGILLIGGTPGAILPMIRRISTPVILTMAHLYQLSDLLVAAEQCPQLYASTRLLIGPRAIETAAAYMGHERLLFGSHAPLAYQASALRMVTTAALSEEQRAAILGGNLQRLLGGSNGHR